jgi:bacterioferritin (cytochrome b1)
MESFDMANLSQPLESSSRGTGVNTPPSTTTHVPRRRSGLGAGAGQAVFKQVQGRLLVSVFRQIVHNTGLHIFMMKHYHYLDGFAAVRLKKLVRLLRDPELQSKVERHIVDEEKHAAYFKQRIVELGGSPTLTPAELSLGFLDRFNSHGLGFDDTRLEQDTPLDMRELIAFFVLLRGEEEIGLRFFLAHLRAADEDPTTKRMLEEIVEDERRHVAYLSAELEGFRQNGYQAYVDEVSGPGQRNSRFSGLPIGGSIWALPKILEMYPYQPAGTPMRLVWFFVSPLMRVSKNRGER